MILYFVDNMVDIIYNGKILHYTLSNAIHQGRVINKDNFIIEFNKIIKKEKIKSKIFGDKITIVKEGFYTPPDIYYLEQSLEELGFVKINYIPICDLFSEKELFVEVNNTYLVIHLKEDIFIDFHVFKDIPFILGYFKNFYDRDLVLFGKNKEIPNIKLKDKEIYYIDDYMNFVAKSLLKVKKDGV